MKIGDFTIRAQKIQENSIDGYCVICQYKSVIFEGEMIRSKKNGFGIQYNPKGKIIY